MRRLLWGAILGSCAMQDNAHVVDEIVRNGFTCEAKREIAGMSERERDELRDDLLAVISRTKLLEMADQAPSCPGNVVAREQTEAITASYQVVFMPKSAGSGGVNASRILRDGAATSWMCSKSGGSEWPADFIAEYRLAGAYAGRAQLKVRPTNIWAYFYLQPSNATRVYTDDSLRMCVGFLSVFLSGSVTPLPSDTAVFK